MGGELVDIVLLNQETESMRGKGSVEEVAQ